MLEIAESPEMMAQQDRHNPTIGYTSLTVSNMFIPLGGGGYLKFLLNSASGLLQNSSIIQKNQ